MLGNPAGGRVSLVDRGGELRFGGRRIVDIHCRSTGAHHKVTDQAFVGRVVTQHPTATVEEHEYRQFALGPCGPNHTDLQWLTTGLDGPAFDAYLRHIDLYAGLGSAEHRTGILGRQGLQRLAATGGQGVEETLGGVFDTGAAGGEGAVHGKGQQAGAAAQF
ncbi:hypothetical protein WR25_27289 [Diploscapter pachys]|uniref:Uncharacterized protein n=1 Tax=Diploscapter pachys TaxID=2018661 RepID=A0A2A2M4P0_9BILA|nr:hypothetical protein WR25_27289 [Diploscapter pachys]